MVDREEHPTQLTVRITVAVLRGSRRACERCKLRRVVYSIAAGPWLCKVCAGL